MKKYTKPTSKVVFINSSSMIAGSFDVSNDPTNTMLSKRHSYFFEEEEEEEN